MQNIDRVIENAVLLDTEVSEYGRGKKSVYTAFMHKFYAIVDIDGRRYIAKLSVDESYMPNQTETNKKFYHVRAIKIETAPSVEIGKSHTSIMESAISTVSISNLHEIVKEFDKDFTPASANPALLNKDGTPKKFYHGTPNATFTEFKDWQYFTDSKAYADVYQNQGASSNGYKKTATNPDTYEVYVRGDKIFDTRNAPDREIFEKEFYGKWGNGAPLSEKGLPDWTDGDDLIEFFEEQGYDYDAIFLDEGATGGYGSDVNSRGVSIVVKDSTQIKSTGNAGTFNKNRDIMYSDRTISNSSVKDQLKEAASTLAAMDTVAEVNESRTFQSKQDVKEWILEEYSKFDYKVTREGFGQVIVDKKRISSGLRYLKGKEDVLAFKALPKVIKEGIEIGSHLKHKGRDYDTITFAAPIVVNGKRGNMAVIVRRDDKNYYKVHRLLMPDGSQFVLENEKDTAERAGGVDNNSSLSPTDNVFDNSISSSGENTTTFSQFSDRTTDNTAEILGEKARLEKENSALKADIARLRERLALERKVTGGNAFNENLLDAAASLNDSPKMVHRSTHIRHKWLLIASSTLLLLMLIYL